MAFGSFDDQEQQRPDGGDQHGPAHRRDAGAARHLHRHRAPAHACGQAGPAQGQQRSQRDQAASRSSSPSTPPACATGTASRSAARWRPSASAWLADSSPSPRCISRPMRAWPTGSWPRPWAMPRGPGSEQGRLRQRARGSATLKTSPPFRPRPAQVFPPTHCPSFLSARLERSSQPDPASPRRRGPACAASPASPDRNSRFVPLGRFPMSDAIRMCGSTSRARFGGFTAESLASLAPLGALAAGFGLMTLAGAAWAQSGRTLRRRGLCAPRRRPASAVAPAEAASARRRPEAIEPWCPRPKPLGRWRPCSPR